jgi:hypothetical protein
MDRKKYKFTRFKQNKMYKDNDFENPLIKKQNNSFSKSVMNPLLNDYKKYENDFSTNYPKSNKSENNNITNIHKFQRNKTLEYINSKYNYNKDINSLGRGREFSTKDINYTKTRDNLLQNIIQKYSKKKQLNNNIFNIISNKNNYNTQKNDDKGKDTLKKKSINYYMYNSQRQINENKNFKKNANLKCSVLSKEASRIIRDYNKKQKEKERILNIGNINYSNGIPIISLNKDNNKENKNKNYAYIDIDMDDDDDNQNCDCNTNDVSDYENYKIKIMPSKITKSRINIMNNNYLNSMNYNKERNNYNCYRKIKHNTSKNQYYNN